MDQKTDELVKLFVASGNDFDDWIPQYSLAPTDVIPIIRERQHGDTGEVTRTVEAAEWNFHPAFMKDAKRPQFNARIETVATNGLWKGAFAGGRCIVPMRGYYEWSEIAADGAMLKQPHFIHGDAPLLAAAGICTARRVDDEWIISTAIVTREARDASGEVHDRMPAFLDQDSWDQWLNPAKLATDAEKESTLEWLREVSSGVAATITTYEVDRRVNNSRTIDPTDASLIEPV